MANLRVSSESDSSQILVSSQTLSLAALEPGKLRSNPTKSVDIIIGGTTVL
jgi:hypothetical protein